MFELYSRSRNRTFIPVKNTALARKELPSVAFARSFPHALPSAFAPSPRVQSASPALPRRHGACLLASVAQRGLLPPSSLTPFGRSFLVGRPRCLAPAWRARPLRCHGACFPSLRSGAKRPASGLDRRPGLLVPRDAPLPAGSRAPCASGRTGHPHPNPSMAEFMLFFAKGRASHLRKTSEASFFLRFCFILFPLSLSLPAPLRSAAKDSAKGTAFRENCNCRESLAYIRNAREAFLRTF